MINTTSNNIAPSQDYDLDTDSDVCPICFNNFKNKNRVITHCSHKLCLDCFKKILQTSNKCPICRVTLEDNIENTNMCNLTAENNDVIIDSVSSLLNATINHFVDRLNNNNNTNIFDEDPFFRNRTLSENNNNNNTHGVNEDSVFTNINQNTRLFENNNYQELFTRAVNHLNNRRDFEENLNNNNNINRYTNSELNRNIAQNLNMDLAFLINNIGHMPNDRADDNYINIINNEL